MRTKKEISDYCVGIGKALRTIRTEKGLPMKAVAEELEVSIAQVSRWENGINGLPVETFVRYCNFLDVPFREIDRIAEEYAKKGK